MAINTSISNGCLFAKVNASLYSAHSGLISWDGNFNLGVSIDTVDNTKIAVLAGTGQFIDSTTTIADARIGYIPVSWPAQVIDGPNASNVPGFDPDDSRYVICVNKQSEIVYVNNGTSIILTPEQNLDLFQIGVLSSMDTVTRVITRVVTIGVPPYSSQANDYALYTSLGGFNFQGVNGVLAVVNIGGLTMGFSPGTAYGALANYAFNPRNTNTNVLPEVAVVGLVFLVESVSGVFSISATAEVDPTKVENDGFLTNIAPDPSNPGEVTILALNHGMQPGDTIDIRNTSHTPYNSRFVIQSVTGDSINILSAETTVVTSGTWSGITAVASQQFTGQKLLLFRVPILIAAMYGRRQYTSIDEFEDLNGEISEEYVEPEPFNGGLLSQVLVCREDLVDFAEDDKYKLRRVSQRIKP